MQDFAKAVDGSSEEFKKKAFEKFADYFGSLLHTFSIHKPLKVFG
jgi:hypothetical protein